MATDFTKQPLQIIIDLINETNSTALTASDITFTPITALGSGNRNTEVTINAVNGSGYTGSRTLTYDRVDFATVPGTRSKVFQKGSAVNISDLIPAINAAYNLNLQAADFVDGPLPALDGGDPAAQANFDLVAKATSYVWRGQVTLTLDGNDVDLADIITVTELDGLNYPVV